MMRSTNELAWIVRRAAEPLSPNKNLAGYCYACSNVLTNLLKRHGYKAQLVVGLYNDDFDHCWVELANKQIIDVTATQFGVKYEVYTPWLTGQISSYEALHKGPAALRYVKREWSSPDDEDDPYVIPALRRRVKRLLAGKSIGPCLGRVFR